MQRCEDEDVLQEKQITFRAFTKKLQNILYIQEKEVCCNPVLQEECIYEGVGEAYRVLKLEQQRRSALEMELQADPLLCCRWCPGDQHIVTETQY